MSIVVGEDGGRTRMERAEKDRIVEVEVDVLTVVVKSMRLSVAGTRVV